MSYVDMMKTINEYDPNGSTDGGVVHDPVECIMLHGCPEPLRCPTLGMCGCAFVYDRSHDRGGYIVMSRANPIREALLKADMVRERPGELIKITAGNLEVRTVCLTANIKCGIPRPNTTIDLSGPPRTKPWSTLT